MEVHEIDKLVGLRVKLRRQQLGISQTALGRAAGVTFQQIQKYELAVNRISVGKLVKIAEALSIPPSSLLPDAPALGSEGLSRQALRVGRMFDRINDATVRRELGAFIRAISGPG